MAKENLVERINYSGGLLGLFFGSSKGKLQNRVTQLNKEGWNLHLIHNDGGNLLIVIFRIILLCLTLFMWTIGSSELLVFEREKQ